jgi:hypothetical protein
MRKNPQQMIPIHCPFLVLPILKSKRYFDDIRISKMGILHQDNGIALTHYDYLL